MTLPLIALAATVLLAAGSGLGGPARFPATPWRRFGLSALIALAATGAQASCPTRADLSEGVVLVQNTPAFVRSDFDIVDGGIRETRVDRLDGSLQARTRLLAHGLLDISGVDYDDDPGALDALPETGRVILTGALRDAARPVPVAFAATYLGDGTQALAECRYDTWQVRVQELYEGRAGPAFVVDFAPALGLVLAVAELDAAGATRPLYAYQWAGTAADVER